MVAQCLHTACQIAFMSTRKVHIRYSMNCPEQEKKSFVEHRAAVVGREGLEY